MPTRAASSAVVNSASPWRRWSIQTDVSTSITPQLSAAGMGSNWGSGSAEPCEAAGAFTLHQRAVLSRISWVRSVKPLIRCAWASKSSSG